MDPERLTSPRGARRRRATASRAAIRYVRGEPSLLIPLAMMVVVGTLAFNFQVLLPLLGRFTFDGGATAYTALAVAMAIGSVGGALATGARGRVSERIMVGSAARRSASPRWSPRRRRRSRSSCSRWSRSARSASPSPPRVNSTLQLGASPAMRGRVMALYSVVFLGSTPIGSPLVGWLAEVAGPRSGLVLGGIAALAAAVGGWIAFARRRDPEFSAVRAVRGAAARRR